MKISLFRNCYKKMFVYKHVVTCQRFKKLFLFLLQHTFLWVKQLSSDYTQICTLAKILIVICSFCWSLSTFFLHLKFKWKNFVRVVKFYLRRRRSSLCPMTEYKMVKRSAITVYKRPPTLFTSNVRFSLWYGKHF